MSDLERRIADAKRISEQRGESPLEARRRMNAAIRPDPNDDPEELTREQEAMVQAAERETW